MEITGKIIQILEAQTGSSARGEWKKQDFIIETQEQYPKKVCIENWNDKIDFNTFGQGSAITVSINIESREFNGRWYTGVKAWKAGPAGSSDSTSAQGGYTAPAGDIPPPSEEISADDLPF